METEPILVKSKISISTIFIIIAVFLCIGVIIFIIINNKSKTPDCKNKCNNADDGAGGKCTKKCDIGMKCIDKTCVCAPDCSDTTKCDDGCGGTCPTHSDGDVCYQGNWCKKKCDNDCDISDGCGGQCKCGDDIQCINNKCNTISYNKNYYTTLNNIGHDYLEISHNVLCVSNTDCDSTILFEPELTNNTYIKDNDNFYIKINGKYIVTFDNSIIDTVPDKIKEGLFKMELISEKSMYIKRWNFYDNEMYYISQPNIGESAIRLRLSSENKKLLFSLKKKY